MFTVTAQNVCMLTSNTAGEASYCLILKPSPVTMESETMPTWYIVRVYMHTSLSTYHPGFDCLSLQSAVFMYVLWSNGLVWRLLIRYGLYFHWAQMNDKWCTCTRKCKKKCLTISKKTWKNRTSTDYKKKKTAVWIVAELATESFIYNGCRVGNRSGTITVKRNVVRVRYFL